MEETPIQIEDRKLAQPPGREPDSLDGRDEARRIITSGRISTAVWYLTWPTVLTLLILSTYHVINRAFIGRLGEEAAPALAAVGIGGMITMIQFSVMWGLSAGTSALVARFLGAGRYEDAEEATRQSLILGTAAAIITMIPLVVIPDRLMALAGAKDQAASLGSVYLLLLGAFSVPMFLYTIVTAALRAAGDVRRPLYGGAVAIGLNVLLDWLLIFGKGPFPELGVKGAGLATGISRTVGAALIIWFLRRSVLRGALAHMRAHASWFRRIMNIGWPAMIQNLLWAAGSTVYMRILSVLPTPTAAQAALTIGFSIEMVAVMPGIAYGMAAAPLVGQNLGAGQPDRAERSVWIAAAQAAAIMTFVGAILFILPAQLGQVFTKEQSVISLVVSYLRFNAPAEPPLAVGMVLAGALQGAGDTRMPTWIEFITNWVVRLPLAWFFALTLGWGVAGAWAAMASSTVLYGFLVTYWFTRGKWRTIKV